jgi:threonine aldolase
MPRHRPIDLRSDTVTKPTPEMRRAMAEAEVGDDVFGDDPTVNRLQEKVADLLGKDAAIYVPSGSMANQTSIRSQTQPGDEIICHADSHIYHYEAGAPAGLSGCSLRLLPGERGLFTAEDVRAAVRSTDSHFPQSRLIIVENTHNRGGGTIWPVERIAAIRNVADEFGLRMHLDGARLLNACVATGKKPTDYTKYFDTVSICFSKGLGAPVGSAVASDKETIRRVHRFRKMFGGGMRQAGIIAAGALYALQHNIERLADDHANAKRLALALADMPGLSIDPDTVETNIVYFEVESLPASIAKAEVARTSATTAARSTTGPPAATPAKFLCDGLKAEGVWILPVGPKRIRAVTHLDVTEADIDAAIETFRTTLSAAGSARRAG